MTLNKEMNSLKWLLQREREREREGGSEERGDGERGGVTVFSQCLLMTK